MQTKQANNPSPPRSPSAGLLARLMQGLPPTQECTLSRAVSWRRLLAGRLQPSTAAPERPVEWVGSRDAGVIAVPRDG